MKKLVTTPLTRNIYWATVNESKGLITGEKKDVTDNAIECVLDHMIYQNEFVENSFFGYTFAKTSGGKYVICVYDDGAHIVVKKDLFEEIKEKALKYDDLCDECEERSFPRKWTANEKKLFELFPWAEWISKERNGDILLSKCKPEWSEEFNGFLLEEGEVTTISSNKEFGVSVETIESPLFIDYERGK